MISLRLCRNTLLRLLAVLVVISSLFVPPTFCQETEDSQVFIAGFNAYQQKDYAAAIEKMNEVLQKYPDTPLRDMALFWLSRSYFKAGNQQDAARYLSQFSKEYPDNPLKGTVEEELLSLTARYDKGEKLSVGSPPVKQPDRQAAQKARAEKERIATARAEEAARAAAAAEATRVAALKQAEEKAAVEKKERERLASLKAEEDRLALERATREKAEQQRIAALKAEETRKAAEKAEQDRIAAVKADEAKQAAAAAAEAARLAAARNEEQRMAALKADQERLEKAKLAEQRQAAEKAEQQRIALLKVEEERAASVLLEKQRIEREKAEQVRIAALKQEEERSAAIKAENLRLASEKAEREKIALAKAEQMKLAEVKLENDRLRAEQERAALAKSEQAKMIALKEAEARQAALLKAEQERLAAVKAEESRQAAAAAESAGIAALKAEKARQELELSEQTRLAGVKAEQERLAAAKAAEARKSSAEKAEQERMTLAKAEEARQASLAAESARLAAVKAEEERKVAEKAAIDAEVIRKAAAQAEEQKQAQQRIASEKIRTEKAALREKAIAQYKSILDKYPSSAAATTAAAKLRELGVAVALPPVAETLPENAQVLRLEVAQFAGFEFNLQARPAAFNVARRISVPFEIINRGNGNDSFYLESGFPTAFSAGFAAASSPDVTLNQTPVMAPGETFKGVVSLVIPASSIDGLRIVHPVKVGSRLMAEASQSREVSLTASAPLLRAVIKTDKTQPLPGEKVVYRIAVLNVGSTVAQDVTFRINFPPQMEPVDFATAGFKQETKSALVFDGLQVNSGESREFSVTLQLKDDSIAGQELSTRAELINNPLKTSASFVSNMAYVQPQRGILVRSGSDRIMVIPGQTFTVPFVVTNSGNVREKFKITSSVKGAQDAVIFHDINRDGIRQASEPVISEIGPLAPKEEANVVMEIKTPRTAGDGSEGSVLVSFSSEGDAGRSASGSAKLVYSRPVLQMAMAGRDGRLKPGEVASFDLTITNKGTNLARVVELQSTWPEQLELVAADPANSEVKNGKIIWRFREMGAAEKRIIKVSFRVKPGTGVGTNIQVKNVMTYEDQLGNRY